MTTLWPFRHRRTPDRYLVVYRHRILVRLTHWINAACMTVLLMSGLGIFNGWPALYWGIRTHFDRPLLAMYATPGPTGATEGLTDIFGRMFVTTGWLGLSSGLDGKPVGRGFPAWATIPARQSLALARHWHFLFAWIFVLNGALYIGYAVLKGHLWRDLIPSRQQFRQLGRSLLDHALLRFPKGEEAEHYNVLQKLSYLVVIFVMAPLMVATGLAMSPWIDAAYPQLLGMFGGRQSARTIHFAVAALFVAFVTVHLLMVLLSGFWNNMRSMVTGWYRVERTPAKPKGKSDGG